MAKPGVRADEAVPDQTTAPARTVRRALATAGIATAAAWIAVLLMWHDGVFGFTFDDAFYYFGIARNIADGHGSTFDQINQTNGYHPLWMAISVVPYELGLDDLEAARGLLIFQFIAGWGATLTIVATIVSRYVDDWRAFDRRSTAGAPDPSGVPALRTWATALLTTVFVLVIANPFIVKAFVNGLESGVAVTLYALVLLAASGTTRWLDRSLRWRLGMGALLALLFLARTDAVFLFACLGLWCIAEATTRGREDRTIGASVTAIATVFALPGLTMAAYLAFNQATFGTPVQVSGLVKRAPLDASTLGPFAVFVIVAALIGRHAWRRANGRKASRPTRFPHATAFVLRTSWFAGFCLIIVGYYNLLQTQQWLWYYCPLLLYLIVLLLLAVADIIEVAVRGDATSKASKPSSASSASSRSPGRTMAPLVAVFVIPLALGFAFEMQQFLDPNLRSIQEANRDTGEWMSEHLPDDAVVVSWDAGVVGYFSHRRVVNIDGVVNSVEYHRTMGDGTYTAFLRCERVGYVVNHGTNVDGRDPDIDKLIRDLYGADAATRSTVIETVPFLYSGTTNTGGFELSGLNALAVHVYEIPRDAIGPRPADRCP